MKIFTPFFALVLLALAVAAAAAVSNAKSFDHGRPLYSWRVATRSLSPIQDSEKMSEIRFYMPLRNENLLDEPLRNGVPHSDSELKTLADKHSLAASCLPEKFSAQEDTKSNKAAETISRRLAMWRRILAPSCETVAAATESLKSVGVLEKCERTAFDHFVCAELDVATVKKIFQLRSQDLRRVEEPDRNLARISTTRDVTKSKIPAGFSFVSNLFVSLDAQKHGRRHQRSSLEFEESKINHPAAAAAAAPLQNASSGSGSSSAQGPPLNPSYFPDVPGTDKDNAPQIAFYTTNIPVTLAAPSNPSFHLTSVYFAVKCEDNTVPKFFASNNSISCGASKLPTKINFDIINANQYPNPNVTAGSFTFTVDGTAAGNCATAWNTMNPEEGSMMGDNGTVICPFGMASPFTELTYWQPFVLRANAVFATPATSAWKYGRAYWNSTFFGAATMLPVAGATTEFETARPQSGLFPSFDANYLLTPTTSGYAQVPNDYRKMYGVDPAEPVKVHAELAMGVLEFPGGGGPFGNGYNKTDLKVFVQRTQNTRFNEDLVEYVGLNSSYGAGGESQLDIQMIVGVAPAVPAVFWVFNQQSADFGSVMNSWADQILHPATGPAMKIPVSAWSISYGSPEDGDPASSYSQNMMRCATKIAAASSAGISVFVSSGDAGSSATRGGFVFTPSFPADVPAVISVGATANRYDFNTGALRREVSNAALGDLITSGSGVSTIFGVPSFQTAVFDAVMAPIIKEQNMPRGLASPSLSMMGSYILAVIEGVSQSVSGTSASSPLLMALVTLVNNRLLEAGLPTLQNGNAWVFNNPTLFQDVPAGGDNAFGSGFSNNVPAQPFAWRTLTGFDSPTGYGEIANFTAMVDSIVAWQKAIQAAKNDDSNSTGKALGITFGIFGIICVMFVIYIIVHKRKEAASEAAHGARAEQQGINNGGEQQQGSGYASV